MKGLTNQPQRGREIQFHFFSITVYTVPEVANLGDAIGIAVAREVDGKVVTLEEVGVVCAWSRRVF